MTKVEIGKAVDFDSLEIALHKAALELGLTTKVNSKYGKIYRLGSILEEGYKFTEVMIMGELFNLPQMRVIIGDSLAVDHFHVYRGIMKGIASKHKVEEYLSRVFKYL